MPTIKELRDRADDYRDVLRRKGADSMLEQFEQGLASYTEWTGLRSQIEQKRAEQKQLSKQIGAYIGKEKAGTLTPDDADPRERATQLKTEIAGLEDGERESESRLRGIEMRLPGWLADDVPDGDDEAAAVAIEYRGTPSVPPEFEDAFTAAHPSVAHTPYDVAATGGEAFAHYGLVGSLVDQETAGAVAQSRFYYELDDLVLLDFAISMWAMEFFRSRGFEQMMVTPYMLRRSIEERICYIEAFEDTIFEVPDKDDQESGDLVLLPSSEHSIVAYYLDTIFRPDELPRRVTAWSPCFRREAGARKDTRGLFRVKQFHKVEVHSIVPVGQADAELEKLRVDVQDFLDTLDVPNRSAVIAAGDMDKRAMKQIDVETWMPAQGRYAETHSIATLGTWVSEKAKIRVKTGEGKGAKNEPVANLYATAVAVQRMICAIAENHFDPATRSIVVPDALHKYMMGVTSIEVPDPGRGTRAAARS